MEPSEAGEEGKSGSLEEEGVMLLNLALDSCVRCLWASMWVDEIQTRAEVWVWDMDDCLTCAQGFPAVNLLGPHSDAVM